MCVCFFFQNKMHKDNSCDSFFFSLYQMKLLIQYIWIKWINRHIYFLQCIKLKEKIIVTKGTRDINIIHQCILKINVAGCCFCFFLCYLYCNMYVSVRFYPSILLFSVLPFCRYIHDVICKIKSTILWYNWVCVCMLVYVFVCLFEVGTLVSDK